MLRRILIGRDGLPAGSEGIADSQRAFPAGRNGHVHIIPDAGSLRGKGDLHFRRGGSGQEHQQEQGEKDTDSLSHHGPPDKSLLIITKRDDEDKNCIDNLLASPLSCGQGGEIRMNGKRYVRGANPYMPLWEHVPDGEPRVFTYKGETRVYVYGSHDTRRTEYCGDDYVVWSAPVTDLTDWKCHGVCYRAEDRSILYAPDVVQKGDLFYMYAAEQKGSLIMVARSRTPWGPFTDPVKTELGFDPGILVDDDGRVYAYWGFCASYCAELNEDMATIRPGTLHEHPIGHCIAPWAKDDGHTDTKEAFFEASSPRKIFGKYIYIYSKRVSDPVPELGIHEHCNGFLSYRWSDRPLEGFRDGGDISFNGGEILKDADVMQHCLYDPGYVAKKEKDRYKKIRKELGIRKEKDKEKDKDK
jgi:hypothetical protein